jgi:hypothetical protein
LFSSGIAISQATDPAGSRFIAGDPGVPQTKPAGTPAMFPAGAADGNLMHLRDTSGAQLRCGRERFSLPMVQTTLRRPLAISQLEISRPALGGSSSLFSRGCYAPAMDARVQQHQRIKGIKKN